MLKVIRMLSVESPYEEMLAAFRRKDWVKAAQLHEDARVEEHRIKEQGASERRIHTERIVSPKPKQSTASTQRRRAARGRPAGGATAVKGTRSRLGVCRSTSPRWSRTSPDPCLCPNRCGGAR